MEAALQPNPGTKLNLDNHTTRPQAQIAYLQGIEALAADPEVPRPHIHWLRQQHAFALNDEGWILVAYPTETEARLAMASEAMVRLGHRLRAINAAAGVYPLAVAGTLTPAPFKRDRARKKARRDERQPWERQPVYMPAFLVATTLPHRKQAGSEFTRVNGRVETTLVSTKRRGLPFGVYPRLIVIQLATFAVLTKARHFRVGRTINELLGRMNISNSGGRGGGGQSTLARDQLDRLCTTTFVTTHLSRYGGCKMDVADKWLEKRWDGVAVELSERFFEQATKSAVPLDPFILRQIRRSPLAIDIYGWLTYRMSTLQGPTSIAWPSIERQFGSEYKEPRQFRRRFRQAVERVTNAWPGKVGVELQEKRLVLTPSPPSVASRTERSNAKPG